jgi:cytochrome c551
MVLTAVLFVSCGGVPEDASGSQIYTISCARCHGSDLEGNVGPALGVGSASADATDEYLVTTISRGAGRMPSFSSSLSDEQISRVIDYLREQQSG